MTPKPLLTLGVRDERSEYSRLERDHILLTNKQPNYHVLTSSDQRRISFSSNQEGHKTKDPPLIVKQLSTMARLPLLTSHVLSCLKAPLSKWTEITDVQFSVLMSKDRRN